MEVKRIEKSLERIVNRMGKLDPQPNEKSLFLSVVVEKKLL